MLLLLKTGLKSHYWAQAGQVVGTILSRHDWDQSYTNHIAKDCPNEFAMQPNEVPSNQMPKKL